jgi:hypothetical protein
LRALRLALARAARDIFELPVSVIGATQGRDSLESVPGRLKEENLLLHLDGPGRAIGALSVNRSFMTALIQQQTIGKVTGGEPAERAYTSTDAALVAPLVDEMIKRAADLSEKPADTECFRGFRFGTRVVDLRAMMLLLEAERFRCFDLTVEFNGGVSQGQMLLILPEPVVVAQKKTADSETISMKEAVSSARADLNAVICRLTLSLNELSNLRIGDTLALKDPNLAHADLVSITGTRISTARLGQAGGLRAVRINEVATASMEGPGEQNGFQPEALNTLTHIEDALTLDMPAGIGESEPWNEGLTQALPEIDGMGASEMDFGDFPAMSGADDDLLPDMNVEEAAVEISALAGLSLDGSDLPE